MYEYFLFAYKIINDASTFQAFVYTVWRNRGILYVIRAGTYIFFNIVMYMSYFYIYCSLYLFFIYFILLDYSYVG